ncbi:MAG: hypothetical protein IKN79_03140 [Eubacterium sp.]|nr:hypothetical protein [Eubacterium sp.]
MTTNNRMFGNILTTSKPLKVMSAILVACMLISLTACGTVSKQDVQPTTEHETEAPINVDPAEPDDNPDDGYWHDDDDTSENPTEKPSSTEEPNNDNSQTGLYTYTVYGDIQLSMDVNIDEWIDTNSSGQEFFKFDRLSQSLGWLPENQDLASFGNGSAAFYTYQTGDMTVVLRIYGNDSWGNASGYNHPQICGISYYFGQNDNIESRYYSDINNLTDEERYAMVQFQQHYDNIDYMIAGFNTVMASRDDVIVLAYMLSNVERDAEKNPLVNTGLMRYQDGGGERIDFLLP